MIEADAATLPPDSVTPIAFAVAGPTRPSAARPFRLWKAATAERVFSPYRPSAVPLI